VSPAQPAAPPKPPLNYTTEIPARRTATECQDLLWEAGAGAVSIEAEHRRPVALTFQLPTPAGDKLFRLPVGWQGVHSLLVEVDRAGAWPKSMSQGGAGRRQREKYVTPEHALNVAWRVARDWLEAQLAIIAARGAEAAEVMLPYMLVDPKTTVYQAWAAENALEASK
jgi:hypothetical protein